LKRKSKRNLYSAGGSDGGWVVCVEGLSGGPKVQIGDRGNLSAQRGSFLGKVIKAKKTMS